MGTHKTCSYPLCRIERARCSANDLTSWRVSSFLLQYTIMTLTRGRNGGFSLAACISVLSLAITVQQNQLGNFGLANSDGHPQLASVVLRILPYRISYLSLAFLF